MLYLGALVPQPHARACMHVCLPSMHPLARVPQVKGWQRYAPQDGRDRLCGQRRCAHGELAGKPLRTSEDRVRIH